MKVTPMKLALCVMLYITAVHADENINEQPYTLATQETVIGSDEDPNVFREYNYLIGGQGGNMKPFNKFQLKIVFRSTNQAKVPRITDLRIIALAA